MILISGASRGIGKYLLEKYVSGPERVIGLYHKTAPTANLDSFDAAACHCIHSRINKGNFPGLGFVRMNDPIAIASEVESHIRFMQEIVRKIFLDQVSFVAKTNDKIIEAVKGVGFHNVPQNRPFTDFDHRFRFQMRLFADTRPETACKNHNFHIFTILMYCFFFKI